MVKQMYFYEYMEMYIFGRKRNIAPCYMVLTIPFRPKAILHQ
jgi:hypothetical protein